MLMARRSSSHGDGAVGSRPARLRATFAIAASVATAFAFGTQMPVTAAHATVNDSCTYADHNQNSTTVYVTTNLYNCHPSTGNALPTGGVIGSVPGGSHPAIYGHWWNTVAVDGDGGGSTCQPSTKWLTGSAGNWYSATCTAAP
jgi:hypothetical protein